MRRICASSRWYDDSLSGAKIAEGSAETRMCSLSRRFVIWKGSGE
jgi:hypothetical protein